MPTNTREIIAAAPDAFALAIGAPVQRPHPLAESLSLRDIAYAVGYHTSRPGSIEPDMSVAARGLTSSDFSALLADGVRSATLAAYDSQAEHLAFVAPFDVPDFKPVSLPAVEADTDLRKVDEHGVIQQFVALLGSGAVKVGLTSYAARVGLSRIAMVNNQLAEFGTALSGIGANVGRLEARLVAEAMDGEANLDDGAPVFDAEHLNIVASALDAAALGVAMANLRLQPTASGQKADLRARHLVVAPDAEVTARTLVREGGLDLIVSVLANLTTGRWYLLADPKLCPTVGVLRLAGAKKPLRVESGVPRYRASDAIPDASFVTVAADLGACLLRRVGIVRGGA